MCGCERHWRQDRPCTCYCPEHRGRHLDGRPQPPVTADHAPVPTEAQIAEADAIIRDGTKGNLPENLARVLAERDALRERVEGLADEWDDIARSQLASAPVPPVIPIGYAIYRLHALLDPDPSPTREAP